MRRVEVGMVALVALLGFTLDDGVQVGEDSVPLGFTPDVQVALSDRPAVEGFRDRWGDWRIRWDERNATPRTAVGPPSTLEQAPVLAAEIAHLGGIDPRDLVLEGTRTASERTGIRFRQTWRGAPIENGFVDVVATDGRVDYVGASLHRVDLADAPRPGEVVLPRDDGGRLTYSLVTRQDDGQTVTYRDRAGTVVHRWTRRMPLDVTYYDREPSGPLTEGPARNVSITDGVARSATDDAGGTELTGPLDVYLDTPAYTAYLDNRITRALGVDDGVIDVGVDTDPSSAAIGPFFYTMRDWLASRDPAHPYLSADVALYLDTPGTCNAFYGGGSVTFYRAGGGCPATAQLSDVVYHENGHGIHDYGLVAGAFVSDVSEGSGDFVSATINDDPDIAVGFFGPGTFLREIATDKVYPQDLSFDPHASGLIWAGFWWDVREDYVDQLGYDDGTLLTDQTFLAALSYGPEMTDYQTVLAADDDDGDLSNGTPHECTLLSHGAEHGIAPSANVLVHAIPDGPGDRPTGHPDDPDTTVSFHLAGIGDCTDIDPDSVRVQYAVDPLPGSDISSIRFTEVEPTHADWSYQAAIPPFPAGAHVAYYVTWSDSSGSASYASAPATGRVEQLFGYWVGDQADVWCDDFEGGQGGWTTGGGALDGGPEQGRSEFEWGPPPSDRAFGATSAWSGTSVLGQNLTSGGPYLPNNEQHATSPSIDLSDANASLLLLTYERWLSVEPSQNDRALVVVDGLGPVWGNPRDSALIDGGWVPVEHDLRDLAGAASTAVSFTLSSDQATGYDGWNVDDVCLRTLADPGRHYRGSALAATDDQADGVHVAWTAPWVEPLRALRLVRSRDGVPPSPSQGEALYTDDSPAPGAAGAFVDTHVTPGETWTYALFAQDVAGHWYDAALGENADEGGVPALPATTTTTPDTTTTKPGEDGGGGGCGCETAPTPGWAVVGLGLLLVRRRRY